MNEIVKVGNENISVVEWKGQRVITTTLLAEVYETDANNVKNNFNNHKSNFVEGKHFFLLQGEELREFKNNVNDVDLVGKNANRLYLWTERGANRHCKILDTDKAWEQFDNLEETYFKVKEFSQEIPKDYPSALRLAANEYEKRVLLEKENATLLEDNHRMKPKEIFADAVSTSHTSILVGDLAKLIKQNGVDIGQKRMFAWMRDNGYLIKRKGSDWNMPTQKSMEMELFEVKENTVNNPDGSVRINRTTKVTGKGQQYFINKFLGNRERSAQGVLFQTEFQGRDR